MCKWVSSPMWQNLQAGKKVLSSIEVFLPLWSCPCPDDKPDLLFVQFCDSFAFVEIELERNSSLWATEWLHCTLLSHRVSQFISTVTQLSSNPTQVNSGIFPCFVQCILYELYRPALYDRVFDCMENSRKFYFRLYTVWCPRAKLRPVLGMVAL